MPWIGKSLWEKVRFAKGSPGCCGNLWGSRSFSPGVGRQTHANATGEEIGEIHEQEVVGRINLATALAEEQQMRLADSSSESAVGRPPLISWLENEEEEREQMVPGLGENCCVCMERKKGAAFIPCGHAFCRTCARELWIERQSCALCNQTILEILDIF